MLYVSKDAFQRICTYIGKYNLFLCILQAFIAPVNVTRFYSRGVRSLFLQEFTTCR